MKKLLFLSLVLSFALSISAQNEPPKITTPISGGVVNGKAISLVKPIYPAAAKAVRASGTVNVQVLIDEEGNVVSATAISGHPLLRAASEQAARASKFSPTQLGGQAVRISGVIVYNFVASFMNWIEFGRDLGSKDLIKLKNSPLEAKSFTSERKELDEIVVKNEPKKLDSFIETLQAKIYEDKTATWELSVGLALGRIKAGIDNENEVRTQLLKIKELSDFPAEGTSTGRLSALEELTAFISKSKFSKADKLKIAEICNSIN